MVRKRRGATRLAVVLMCVQPWLGAPVRAAVDGPKQLATKTFDGAFSTIEIENPFGATVVEAEPDGSSVRVAVSRGSGSRIDLDKDVSWTESPNGDLRAVVTRPGTNLTLFAPTTTFVTVAGKDARVDVRGDFRGVRVTTGSGQISVYLSASARATIDATSTHGAVRSELLLEGASTPSEGRLTGMLGGGGGAGWTLVSQTGDVVLFRGGQTAGVHDGDDAIDDHMPPPPKMHVPPGVAADRERAVRKRAARERRLAAERETEAAATRERRAEDAAGGDLTLASDLVDLSVKVVDSAGKPVPGLARTDFEIFDEEKQQEITFFEPVAAPVDLLLLLDLSGSTKDRRGVIKRAAKHFVDALAPEDRVAVATFSLDLTTVSPFTGDRSALAHRIDGIGGEASGTAFYDAMWSALDLFPSGSERRKVLVVMTDGVDNSDTDPTEYVTEYTFDELLVRLGRDDVTIYPLYLDTEQRDAKYGDNREAYAAARDHLQRIAAQTGGSLFKANGIDDLDGVYPRVAAELHSVYRIGYYAPDAARPQTWRHVRVSVDRDRLHASTRPGYYTDGLAH